MISLERSLDFHDMLIKRERRGIAFFFSLLRVSTREDYTTAFKIAGIALSAQPLELESTLWNVFPRTITVLCQLQETP